MEGEIWQKDMLSVVKRATSVPVEAVLREWSGVAYFDLTPYKQHIVLSIFRTYAESHHVAVHMANRGKCYVVSCHAQLLGSDMETI